MNKLWFRRKTYGWGWYPVSWEGWLVILGFVVAIGVTIWRLQPELQAGHPLKFVVAIVIEVVVLIAICRNTGEKPKWQWGDGDRK